MSTLTQNVLDEFISKLKKKYKNILQDFNLECTNDEHGMYITLILIKIKKSQIGKGYGSAVMYELSAFADLHNVRIRLYLTNLYGTDLKALYAFYGKHGFVLIKNTPQPIIGESYGKKEMIYYPVKNHNKL